MDSGMEFSPAIQVPVAEIQAHDYMEVSATLNFIPKEPIGTDAVLLVLSVDFDHKSVSYNKMDLLNASGSQELKKMVFPLKLNANFPQGAILSLYVWNKDKKQLLLGDLKLTINGY